MKQRSFARECACVGLIALGAGGCAAVPEGQYGIETLTWKGVDQMSPDALEACLATRARDVVRLRVGLGAPGCGEPPFDSDPPDLELLSLPWSAWPVYDPAILGVDRKRIERWYHARGYYDARVERVTALVDDEQVRSPVCEGGDCRLKVSIEVVEGEPVRVERVDLAYARAPSEAVQTQLEQRIALAPDARFDEYIYEADKARLARLLRDAAYARAEVTGRVVIDRAARTAAVTYRVDAGEPFLFGAVDVQGADRVPAELIALTADIPVGEPFSEERLDDAQRAVFALGVFSSVKLSPQPRSDGTVTVTITVRTASMVTPSLGVGVMSGTLQRATSDEVESVPQWDVHLRAAYEHKNLFGSLQRLRIEDRPRLIMLDDFPRIPSQGPRLGNVLTLDYEQPNALERRTVVIGTASWDLGPDPFFGFFRHDVSVKVGLRRAFLKQRLSAQLSIAHDLYLIADDNAPDSVTSYRLPFLEQQVRLDLRDDGRRPQRGAYASVTVQEAARVLGYGSWDYLRVIPDGRVYLPLFFRMVLAARFTVAGMFIWNDYGVSGPSRDLGPQAYRLRGGGANGHRGFFAGELGPGRAGGVRRWLASLELRVPLGRDVGAVVFSDAGDVSQTRRFRFTRPHTAAGLGLRYYSLLGAIRLDAAWRIPGLQRFGGGGEDVRLRAVPSAFHLTIGEAF